MRVSSPPLGGDRSKCLRSLFLTLIGLLLLLEMADDGAGRGGEVQRPVRSQDSIFLAYSVAVKSGPEVCLSLAASDRIDEVASKEIILLGEAAHGSAELPALYDAIARRMVAKHGYRTVCIEAPAHIVEVVDDYCRGRTESLPEMKELLPNWHWGLAKLESFACYLRTWNSIRPGAEVALVGIDNSYIDIDLINRFLLLAGFPALEGEWIGDVDRSVLGQLTLAVERALTHVGAADMEAMQELLVLLCVARDCLDILHAGIDGGLREVRDMLMAANVLDVVEGRGLLGGVLVLAHNDHVAAESYDSGDSMGMHLRRVLGKKVAIIGSSVAGGSILVEDESRGVNSPEHPVVVTFDAAGGSLDRSLMYMTCSPVLLDLTHGLKGECIAGRALCQEVLQINMGGRYSGPGSAYILRKACSAFDALFFFPEVRSSEI